jgi:carboxyl-terminal processing protease
MSPRTRLVIALLSTAAACYVFVGALLGRVAGDSAYGQLALLSEVLHRVTTAYVEPVDPERALRDAQFGLMEALDGESALLDSAEFAAYVKPRERQDADAGLAITRRFGFLLIVATRPGSPGERAGLRTGDVIKTIDGRHTRSLGVPTGERLLRGAPGSVVELAVMRQSNDPLVFKVVREKPALAPPRLTRRADGVAVLAVAEFADATADQVREQLEELSRSGVERLVLDLRGAAFGAPEQGVRVAELFLKGGVVTRLTRRRAAEKVLTAEARRTAWSHALAVLIGTGTAGPGEIVAAALADAKRGSLIGGRTIGRAGVQQAIPIPQGGLVLTVGKYLSPAGTPIHLQGVTPTVAVEEAPDAAEGTEPRPDPPLEKAIEILNAPAAKAADDGGAHVLTTAVLRWRPAGRTSALPA